MSTDVKLFDAKLSIEGQRALCEEKDYPHFAPLKGICWSCRKNIYTQVEKQVHDFFSGDLKIVKTGISVEKARKELVTGCPHCNRSYCEKGVVT